MKLNDLKPAQGAKKARKRVGRGLGSGRGKTAGRGTKGQRSRSGFSQGAGWEGGRSRLIVRLPKRGFNNATVDFQVVNLKDLERFQEGATVNLETLMAVGLVGNKNQPVKLLGGGECSVKNLTIDLDAYSKSAIAAVEAQGGKVVGANASEETA